MPKCTCLKCGAEIIEVPLDEEENFTLPVCSNDDCPTNSSDFCFNNDISRKIEQYPQSPASDQETRISVLRSGLDTIRVHILLLIENCDMLNAKALLEDVINSFLPEEKIPPGRHYATKSKAYRTGMKGTGLKRLNADAGDPGKLTFLTKGVFNWLLQTEDELRQERIEKVSSWLELLRSQTTAYRNSAAGVKMMETIQILIWAIKKIDREGSPPVLDTRKLTA